MVHPASPQAESPGRPDTAQPGAGGAGGGAGGGTGGTSPEGSRTNRAEGSLERGGGSWPLPAPQPHSCTSPRAHQDPTRGAHAASRTQSQACLGEACGSQEEGASSRAEKEARHSSGVPRPSPGLPSPSSSLCQLPTPTQSPGKGISAHTPERLPTALCFSPHSSPPADHWALASGLPTYVAESGFVSPPALPRGLSAPALPT